MKNKEEEKIVKSNKFFIINSLNISMKRAKRRQDDRQLKKKRDDKKHLIDKEERERERDEKFMILLGVCKNIYMEISLAKALSIIKISSGQARSETKKNICERWKKRKNSKKATTKKNASVREKNQSLIVVYEEISSIKVGFWSTTSGKCIYWQHCLSLSLSTFLIFYFIFFFSECCYEYS